MEQYELEHLRKEKKDWEMGIMIFGSQLDTIDKAERYGRIAQLKDIIRKYEDQVIAP